MAPVPSPIPMVSGAAAVRRAHLVRFPSYRLTAQPGLRVELARYGALNIYFFGPGQKIALPWGGRWRLTTIERGGGLAVVVVNEARQKLAMAAAGAVAGNYGINGRDYAYTLNPAEGGWGRARLWDLFAREDRVARLTRRPFRAFCSEPIPLPALLLALLLVRTGIPGEGSRYVPDFRWG
ncbi:MAG: hypothetical protein ABIJ48_11600 [Actinomycetota bacterium]